MIKLADGEFVVSGYIDQDGYHFAITNLGNLWWWTRHQWRKV